MSSEYQVRIEKITALKANAFKEKFLTTTSIHALLTLFREDKLLLDQTKHRLWGRVMALRNFKDSGFCELSHLGEQIQVYVRRVEVDEQSQSEYFDFLDVNDLIGVEATIMYNKAHQLCLRATMIRILTKTLQNLPDKHHGLQNPELVYRNRFLDLIVNQGSRQRFLDRSQIIYLIRDFFHQAGAMEIETPILQPILGGAAAKPFITYYNSLKNNFYLRVAPELFLKKAVVGGFDFVYEIGKVFRNEGVDRQHNPEFTILEVYKANSDLTTMLTLTENLIVMLCQHFKKTLQFEFQGQDIDFRPPWRVETMANLVLETTQINFKQLSLAECLKLAQDHQIELMVFEQSFGHILTKFFDKYVQKTLINPTFVTEFPLEVSPLAKTDPSDERFTQRFELYIAGNEYANAFSELNNPFEQRQRFEQQVKERQAGNVEASMVDENFVFALECGLPPTGGLGIGIDRIVMLLTNANSINDVILFPHLKTKLG